MRKFTRILISSVLAVAMLLGSVGALAESPADRFENKELNIAIFEGGYGPGYWNVSIRVGSRIGLVNTGSGHVFLAFATPEERRLMLEEQDMGSPEKMPRGLETRLEGVRQQGYEMMPSAQVSGVSNLSAPIFGPLGTVIAVLTCPYTQRLDKLDAPNMNEVLRLLLQAGHDVTKRAEGG